MMLRPTFQIGISIHALREEGDRKTLQSKRVFMYFYPRPPRGGRQFKEYKYLFLSYFYPRPPRGGRLIGSWAITPNSQFLSTPSARRATF